MLEYCNITPKKAWLRGVDRNIEYIIITIKLIIIIFIILDLFTLKKNNILIAEA
jgi:hypothetical protein